jgi:hypothetical protein
MIMTFQFYQDPITLHALQTGPRTLLFPWAFRDLPLKHFIDHNGSLEFWIGHCECNFFVDF